jgi:hypothetical protein
MNTFNKKSLYAAVAGLGALGVTGAAQAVSVNPDGLGQALVYPYYTVRDASAGAPYNTLLSVVNSTSSAKAVKVRFLEGKNSREVLDFNLYLSHQDVWTTAVIPTANGAGIITFDKSCTTPAVSSNASAPSEFVNFQYTGPNDDDADPSLDRTREGYIEIIEMGNVTGITAANVTHVAGVPKGCGNITDAQASADTVPGNGGLFGTATLVNVVAGFDLAVDATALDNFSQVAIWQPPGTIAPDFTYVNPKVSVVTNTTYGIGTTTYVTQWPAPATGVVGTVDPVSAVLMHNNIYNEYVLDTATKSGTDWVITMPTKHFYYDQATGEVINLFQRNFTSTGACDDVSLGLFDREEQTKQTSIQFSPPRPNTPSQLCWEANVVTFNNSNVLGSKNTSNIDTLAAAPQFFNGWLSMNFATAVSPLVHSLVSTTAGSTNVTVTPTGVISQTLPTATTFTGLPTIGFAAITFLNGNLASAGGTVLSNYAGVQLHKYTRLITPTP